MRAGIVVEVSASDRARLEAVVEDRSVRDLIPDPPGGLTSYMDAVRLALKREKEGPLDVTFDADLQSSADPAAPLPSDPEWAGSTVYTDERASPQEKTLALMCKRALEMDVPEAMARMIAEAEGQPWGFYVDMCRQLWDEARHAMMGAVYRRPIIAMISR